MGIKKKLDFLNNKQNTITDLIELGQILVKSNGLRRLNINNEIDLKTVFNTKAISMSIVTYNKKAGNYPSHYHEGIVEFLICLKGSFGIEFPCNGYRILKAKECAQIPPNTLHTAISLEANSEILAICLPSEPAYIESEERN